jgi:serine/threonine protein kinase
MNEAHDPNVTSDLPAAATDSLRPAETLTMTERLRAASSVEAPHPEADAPARDLPVVPGYRVQHEIARGGMGRVLSAYDLGLDRDVALKVLLPGAHSDRFVRESKITARLPHPGIPPVHALGTLADGSPFLAMKLIAGHTLADEIQRGDRPGLVQAFLQVCQAVGFAHSKGIVHRDLKPANVMVGAFGEVQVMDWGLAKDLASPTVPDEPGASEPRTVPPVGTDPNQTTEDAAAGPATAEGTQAGTVLGTPAYMAPEQARGEPTDARTDVFALGGILCVILTGRPPFAGKTNLEVIRRAAVADLAEAHARLDGCGADAELVGLCRRCLSPSPADRPCDGQAVADGLTAYLGGVQEKLRQAELAEAEARAKAAEEAKRRRLTLTLASLVLLVLLAGISGTTIGLFQAQAAQRAEAWQRQEAEQAAKAERLAKLEAEAKRKEAERNLAFAKKGNEILGSVFAGLDPKANYATVADLSNALRDNLNKAVKDLEGSAIGEPLEVAAMQNKLGMSLLGLGKASLAVEVLQKVLATFNAKLGPDHPDTLVSMNNLAAAYQVSGQVAKAVPLYEAALEKTKAKLGPDHTATLGSMDSLALAYQASGQLAKAVPLHQAALEKTKAKLGPDHSETLTCMNNLAVAYWRLKRLDRSIPLFEELLKRYAKQLGRHHPRTLQTLASLGVNYRDARRPAEAIPLLEEALEMRKAKLGPDHPDTLANMDQLATAYQLGGQLAKAVPLLEETLEKEKAKLGPDHPNTLISMNQLAGAYHASGQRAKAVPLYEETLEKMKAKLGPDHPTTLTCMSNLGRAYHASGQLAKAVPLLEQALEKRKAKLGPDHPATFVTMSSLALAYLDSGQLAKAVPLFEQLLQKQKAKFGAEHPETLGTMSNLGSALLQQKKWADAEPSLRECLTIREKTQPDAWNTFNTQSLLGRALLGQKKYAEAEPLLVKGYEGLKAREKTIPKQGGGELRIPEALDQLIELYTALNKPDEAKKWEAERAKYTRAKKPVAPEKK